MPDIAASLFVDMTDVARQIGEAVEAEKREYAPGGEERPLGSYTLQLAYARAERIAAG